MSRAYYAAFHVARRFVEARDPDLRFPKDGNAHERVWAEMRKHDEKTSTNGNRLRVARNRADYRPDQTPRNWRQEADHAVLFTQSVVGKLEPPPTPPPPQHPPAAT